MDRRTFLTLLASAPIAALAPWPQLLPKPIPIRLMDPNGGISIRYIKQWDMIVSGGTGFIRRGTDANGDLVIDRI